MKVSTMRRLDSWIGVPLCWAATVLVRASRLLPKRAASEESPRRLLVIKLSELGALIVLRPAMRVLSELVARDYTFFLVFAESRPLLELLDYIPPRNIIAIRTDSLGRFLRDLLAALRRCRALGIDCAVDLEFFSRVTALFALLSGARRRVGCHAYFGEGPYRGDLLTHRVKFNPHLHAAQMLETLAAAATLPPRDLPRMPFVPAPAENPRWFYASAPEESSKIETKLAESGVGSRDILILLNANISDSELLPLRKWPDSNYAELARLILADIPRAFVLLTGGANDVAAVAALEKKVGLERCRSWAGETSMRELLTLYNKASVLVTNDSGPAHFATLTGVDVVVLFGPETPRIWRPLGDKVHVLYRGLACSPCFTVYNGRQSACRRNICLDIPPAEVSQILKQIIERRLLARQETETRRPG